MYLFIFTTRAVEFIATYAPLSSFKLLRNFTRPVSLPWCEISRIPESPVRIYPLLATEIGIGKFRLRAMFVPLTVYFYLYYR